MLSRNASPAENQLPPTPPSEPSAMGTKLAENHHEHTSMLRQQSGQSVTKHIWVVTGPAGCGKTSVAEFLHTAHVLPYLEGDLFHPSSNVQKMADGHPLTDADRWDWLILLREEALKTLQTSVGVIVTCSALKRKYRDVMRVASYHHPEIAVHFIFLKASEALLIDRVRARQNHYMKDSMVRSQFENLETPQVDETDVLSVDASGASKEVQDLALAVFDGVMKTKSIIDE